MTRAPVKSTLKSPLFSSAGASKQCSLPFGAGLYPCSFVLFSRVGVDYCVGHLGILKREGMEVQSACQLHWAAPCWLTLVGKELRECMVRAGDARSEAGTEQHNPSPVIPSPSLNICCWTQTGASAPCAWGAAQGAGCPWSRLGAGTGSGSAEWAGCSKAQSAHSAGCAQQMVEVMQGVCGAGCLWCRVCVMQGVCDAGCPGCRVCRGLVVPRVPAGQGLLRAFCTAQDSTISAASCHCMPAGE